MEVYTMTVANAQTVKYIHGLITLQNFYGYIPMKKYV